MDEVLRQLEATAGEVFERVGPATVAIGRAPRGSGVVVAPDRVLTNAHNLRDRTTQVTLEHGSRQGAAIAVDTAFDLAVLEVDVGSVEPIEWAERAPGVGAVVFGLARGAAGTRLSTGFVSGTGRSFRGPGGRAIGGSIEHTAPMARGSSGGPLLDATGAVVGLNTHRLGEGFYLAQSASSGLVERVAEMVRGHVPRRAELRIAVAPPGVARRLRRSVGLPERDGALVRAVEPDGSADRAGVREGDLIVGAGPVGGEATTVTAADDLHQVLGSHDPGAALRLLIVRGVDELELTVTFDDPDGSAGDAGGDAGDAGGSAPG